MTITVSWSGGGDIITKEVEQKGWTMETLKAVAISFADKVALCPQKTSAILTKYSSLRSFYEKSLHGSPLDYENASVYSSSLLDAYMDYKAAWKELQAMSWQVNNGLVTLRQATSPPELAGIANAAKDNFEEQTKAYEESLKALAEQESDTSLVRYNSSAAKSPKRKIEKPLPPNGLIPYTATVYGLDKAQRECRFEMIKIVREVDAVAADPQVAVDPTRNNQYLSPIIFRQLIPYVTKVDPAAMKKKIDELEVKIAAEAEELAKGREQLLSITAEKEALSTELASARTGLQSAINDRNTLMSKNETLGDQLRDSEALAQALAKEKYKEVVDLENRKGELVAQLEETKTSLASREGTIAKINTEVTGLKEINKDAAKASEMIVAKEAELDATRQRLKGEEEARAQRETERDNPKTKLEQESRAKGDITAERDNLKSKPDQEAKTKAQLEAELSLVKIQANPNWHQENTLDQGFDGREVAFVNIAGMSSTRPGVCLAMDSSNDQGVWKPFDIDSNYHRFKLERVDSKDRASFWNIRSFASGDLIWYTAHEAITCSRYTGKTPEVELWRIKKLRGQGYTIGNAYGFLEYKQDRRYLEMGNRDGTISSQIWAIIAL